jgi:hypothetical protein
MWRTTGNDKCDGNGWLIGALHSHLSDDKTVAKMGTRLFVARCGEQATAKTKSNSNGNGNGKSRSSACGEG